MLYSIYETAFQKVFIIIISIIIISFKRKEKKWEKKKLQALKQQL